MGKIGNIFTNRLYLSALGVVVVFVLGVAYIFAEVLDQPLTSRPDKVTVKLTSTGGLFVGSSVTYRGVKVGKVTNIEKTMEGVEATVSLTTGTPVPVDSLAKVRSLSPVGEQYLDFQPQDDEGPYLTDGSVIAATSTDLPKSLSSTVVAVNKVLRQIDDTKLRRVLVELSTGLEGTGDDIGRLVDQGDLILAELDRVWPETDRLLVNSDPVLDIFTDNTGNLEAFAKSAKSLTAFVRDQDPELRKQLKTLPGQFKKVELLINDAAKVLPDFLSTGISLTDILSSHEPHLRALLQSYSPGLGVLVKGIRGGKAQLEVIIDADPRCKYSTTRHEPRDPKKYAFQKNGRCSASLSNLQRGAAHAPGPVR